MSHGQNAPVSAGTRGFGSRTPSANGSPMASANLCGESPGRGGGDGEPASRRRLLEEQLPIETNPYVSRGSRAGADAARLQPRVQDESDPAQDIFDEEEDEGRTLDPNNPVWSGRVCVDTQGNELVLATPSPPPVGDGLEALGAGDETQLGDYNDEEEDAAFANIPAVAPPPFDSAAAASAAATASAASGSRRVLLKDVHQWADIPHEDGAILHVMLNIINGHGPRVYTRPGMHARAAKGEKMDGTVNVQFFCQKLATVNANLQHNGQGFTFGLNKGTAARTVFNKVKTMARQEMNAQMLAQNTGGGAELADNPNQWADGKEPRHTTNGALFPHARPDDDADGLLTLALNALAYEWDAYAAAEKAHEDSLKEKAKDKAKKRKPEPVAPAGGYKNSRLKSGQAARNECLDGVNDDEGGGGPGADEEEESGAAADSAPQSRPRSIPGSSKGATKKTAPKTEDTRGLRATGRSLDTQGSGGGGSKDDPLNALISVVTENMKNDGFKPILDQVANDMRTKNLANKMTLDLNMRRNAQELGVSLEEYKAHLESL